MLRNQERIKLTDIIEYTLKQKMEMGRSYCKNEGQRVDQNAAQSGNQGEGRDQEVDQAEDGKTTRKEGTTWIRKATDRRQWKTLIWGGGGGGGGYILQWIDKT